MGYQLIETIEVGAGGAASIEFTGIPQDAVDLVVKISSRLSDNVTVNYVRLNGSTSNHSYRELDGNGSGASSNFGGGFQVATGFSGAPSSTFSSASIYISNYSSSLAKSMSADSVNENNGTFANARMIAGLYNDTASITSLKLVAGSGNYVEYSTASLYKITAD